jgi:hypothetical protein
MPDIANFSSLSPKHLNVEKNAHIATKDEVALIVLTTVRFLVDTILTPLTTLPEVAKQNWSFQTSSNFFSYLTSAAKPLLKQEIRRWTAFARASVSTNCPFMKFLGPADALTP